MSKRSLKWQELGRRKGSCEKGYFFRTGRQWYVSLDHSMTKLCYADRDTVERIVQAMQTEAAVVRIEKTNRESYSAVNQIFREARSVSGRSDGAEHA